MTEEETLEQPDPRQVVRTSSDNVTIADTAPENPMLKTLRERGVLTTRLIQVLAPLSAARQVEIVASFIQLERLREIVLFQERRS